MLVSQRDQLSAGHPADGLGADKLAGSEMLAGEVEGFGEIDSPGALRGHRVLLIAVHRQQIDEVRLLGGCSESWCASLSAGRRSERDEFVKLSGAFLRGFFTPSTTLLLTRTEASLRSLPDTVLPQVTRTEHLAPIGEAADRQRWFAEAVRAYAHALRVPPPDLPDRPVGHDEDTPLVLHARALLAVLGRAGSRTWSLAEITTLPLLGH